MSRSYGSAVKTQRIVVQSYNGSFRGAARTLREEDVIAELPLERLAAELNTFRQSHKVKNKPQRSLTLASMGPLKYIDFLDDDALLWKTRRGGVGTNNNYCIDSREEIGYPDTCIDAKTLGLGGDICLSLQFTNILTIVRINSNTIKNNISILGCLEPSSKDGSTYHPSSPLLPVTNSIIVYGCSDGAMRFHNLVPSLLYSSRIENMNQLSISSSLFSSGSAKLSKQARQATVKSVRGPNGRNDPIVGIVNVDPGHGWEGEESLNDSKMVVRHSRLLTACSSGVAYLWDVHVQLDRASGSVKDLIVDPPLVRIDGLGKMTISPRRTFPSFESTRGFWEVSNKVPKEAEEPAPYGNVAPAIHYDYHRDLLIWALPAEAPVASIDHRGDFKLELANPKSAEAKREDEDHAYLNKWSGENGGFVKVWNMSVVNTLLSKSKKKEPSGGGHQPPPKFAPAAVYKLHSCCGSAANPSHVMGGLMMSPLTPNSLAYVCLSRDATDLLVQSAPLPITAASTDEAWLVQSSISTPSKKPSPRADKAKIFYANFSIRHKLPISSFRKGISSISKMRGSSFVASFTSPDSFALASDQGVLVGTLAKGLSWYTEIEADPLLSDTHRLSSVSFDTSAGNVHTIISGGPVSSLNNRPGVLFVENNSVYASRLTTRKPCGEHKEAVVEKVGLQDPMMMHALQTQNKPWHELRSTRFSIFAETHENGSSQPRPIPSPSGRYLCLFWEGEMLYEILHARSLLTKEANTAAGLNSRIDPSVDTGSQVLSFAWIGDDDRFAILVYPDIFTTKPSAGQASPARGESEPSPPSLDARSKVFSKIISDGKPGNKSTTVQIRPHVELKKLAEAQIDAVELAAGAGVAAATTVNLGRLSIRGGDRSIPTVLFGGPALCVGCISISNRSDEPCVDDSMAYFYARKSGSIKAHDEKASTYLAIGPEMPYPSSVAWDEGGELCAMAVGSRVAIFMSLPPSFTLLGAVNVSLPSKVNSYDDSLVSLQFIHGVLYCSTQSSVHAVFLGNLNDPDTVCEVDIFTLATNVVPAGGPGSPVSTSPVPLFAPLVQPHILAYHCGGLLVSTACGLRLVPLSHPMIRIGTLLGANLVEKARKWIHAIPNSDHDSMANFLIRRGHPNLAIGDLDGLSVELYIDLCMMYDHADELEYFIDKAGPSLPFKIRDWNRGSVNGSYSAILCIGMYFLAKGRMEIAKKWTEHAMNSGVNEVISDAMKLALYFSAADRAEGEELRRKVSDVLKLDSSRQFTFLETL